MWMGRKMNKIKQIVSWISILVFILFILRITWVALTHGGSLILVLVFASILSILSYGLLKELTWAFRSTAFLYLIIAILLPVWIFNPLRAGDYLMAGKQLPEIEDTLLWLIPVELFLLVVVYILDLRRKNKTN
jgi:hypothetical protein